MAPTLIGDHVRADCRVCNHMAYGSANASEMICSNFHVTPTMPSKKNIFSGDRILVAKFLAPRRWDVVVFQYPGDPAQLYAMRLVGLPGETIHIESDAVWANGEKLTPPDSLRGNLYTTEFPHSNHEVWGSPGRPASLGEDEYFVLGDFSANSFDSRIWPRGAAGHNPYAVAESHLRGVVTHIFWPVQRWKTLR